ncbi:2-oxoglutarate dehydrogenase complex dihydrolipoyllysine-residue succinyltransferase [Fodinicurvata fenggangensis]|uniref:2-oxoglutarate dehydrogenase complex dihydrolipoyllysine-residue succinyltransferase n=1 Tax=Fodinicurvata fenggangensis TaxID=1121830 RepID=UPI00047E3B33|nr:2-oxoglutarate dehydrogenase complex dihydrolipoyllysine-residue succinyltransferase [Fodinicurvata fenggangensis]
MATEIKVPTLGESVTEATVARWLKKAGESVSADEPLVELETDKVTLEVNAPADGTISEVKAEEGANVEVGAVLGLIGEGQAAAPSNKASSEKASEDKKDSQPAKQEAKAEEKAASAPSDSAPSGKGKSGSAASGKSVDVVVPTLGESVSEATVARWLKKPGEAVEADEALVELETDKVTLEVNAPEAGSLSEILAKEGTNVEVGAVLGKVAAGASGGDSAPVEDKEEQSGKAEPDGGKKAADTGKSQPDAKADDDQHLDPSAAPRSGEGGKITADDLRQFVESASPSAASLSPAVAKLVEENDLDPARIQGTGPQGRITKEDVQNVIDGKTQLKPRPKVSAGQAAPAAAAQPSSQSASAESGPREERVRMTKLRQTIARRLKEAQNTAAMLTTFNEVDMGEVMAVRSEFKEAFEKKHGVKLGFTSFFAKAVVGALKEQPTVNARIEGEELVYNKFYDIGMAVSTPNGLMVPVIRDCDSKSYADIEKSLGDVAARARDGKLTMEEMQGGSFTITNGGVFGSLLSTPILNMPQSGILGLHKIQERPMAVNGKVEIRPMMYVAMSYDHRIIDGREAVTFLVRLKEQMENPQRMLLDL